MLRSLWLEQIQNVIQYLHQEMENISDDSKKEINMPGELAFIISELMREQTYQVKKCATSSLIFIVERKLLNNG
jgi:hypothetical protein